MNVNEIVATMFLGIALVSYVMYLLPRKKNNRKNGSGN